MTLAAESMSESLPPLPFPRTWGAALKTLNSVGLSSPYGAKRIVLMEQPEGPYGELRRAEFDVLLAVSAHQPEEPFTDQDAVAKMQRVFEILEISNGVVARRKSTVRAFGISFLDRMRAACSGAAVH